jgi:hypothetical protein
MWLRIAGVSGEHQWKRYWHFGFYKIQHFGNWNKDSGHFPVGVLKQWLASHGNYLRSKQELASAHSKDGCSSLLLVSEYDVQTYNASGKMKAPFSTSRQLHTLTLTTRWDISHLLQKSALDSTHFFILSENCKVQYLVTNSSALQVSSRSLKVSRHTQVRLSIEDTSMGRHVLILYHQTTEYGWQSAGFNSSSNSHCDIILQSSRAAASLTPT